LDPPRTRHDLERRDRISWLSVLTTLAPTHSGVTPLLAGDREAASENVPRDSAASGATGATPNVEARQMQITPVSARPALAANRTTVISATMEAGESTTKPAAASAQP
jgi:hypothetical protein